VAPVNTTAVDQHAVQLVQVAHRAVSLNNKGWWGWWGGVVWGVTVTDNQPGCWDRVGGAV